VKIWRIAAILLLCLASVGTISCTAIGGNGTENTQQLSKVVSSNLTVTVSGSGGIEASRKLSLSFSSNGRIDRIYVEEGDEVSADEVLAKLDTSALELSYNQANINLTQSEIALKQAEIAQQTAEYNLKNIRDSEGALKLALLNAQINLDTAKNNLEQTQDLYTLSDIMIAQADVDKAEEDLENCLEMLVTYIPPDEEGRYPDILEYVLNEDYPKLPGYKAWQEKTVHALARLNAAEDKLDAMLYGFDPEEVTIKTLQIEAAGMSLAQAQKDLDDYDLAEDIAAQELQVQSTKLSVENARQSLELARQSLQEAQRQLDEAGIIAPFDGVVTSVGTEEGDTITAAAPIIYLMDPASKELVVDVDETDVTKVKLGQRAIIEADALPGILLEGKVTYVSPVAWNSAGLMLYEVKIYLDVPDGSHLKVGMSATADIVIEERANVLLVPNRAIKRDSQGNQIVHVMVGEQVQERQVVTGTSDGLQTEIISGLDEGEIVVR
jgi:HlyD family secretion protein